MVSFCILNVFSEEYLIENDGELVAEDLEDDGEAIPRRYVEEMVRLGSRITILNRTPRLLHLLCTRDVKEPHAVLVKSRKHISQCCGLTLVMFIQVAILK